MKDGDKKQEKTAKKSSPWIKVIGAIVIVLAIAGGVYYYFATMDQESTDDAYTDGRSLTISPKISRLRRRAARQRQPEASRPATCSRASIRATTSLPGTRRAPP